MFMSRLDDLIRELCPDGVEFKELGDKSLFHFHYGKGNKIPKNGGAYPVYGCNGIVSSTDTYNCENVSIIGHIGSAGIVNWCSGKAFVTYNGTIADIKDKSKLDSRYLYYVLLSLNLPTYVKGSQPFLSASDFAKVRIPIPPLEVQEGIVRLLDEFTAKTAELQAELNKEYEARKKQYEYYRDTLLNNNAEIPKIKLGEFAVISRGGNFQKKDFVDNGLPCIHYGQIYTHYGTYADTTLTTINEEAYSKSKKAKKNDIVMAVTSENIEDVCKSVAWLGDKDIAVSGHTAIISHHQNAKYLSYYFSSNAFFKQKKKLAHGTKVIEVTPNTLANIEVPLPSLEVQNRLVEVLDNFDSICSDLNIDLPAEIETRQKQYEYYRDSLLTFAETGHIMPQTDRQTDRQTDKQ